jgi:hypothetical protein
VKTADERERRLVEYLRTLHKGQLREFRLTRLNRIANFRKHLMELLEEIIESRAQDLAASMLEISAPERPREIEVEVQAQLALPRAERKRKLPAFGLGLSERPARESKLGRYSVR